jgi:hypothetical protein
MIDSIYYIDESDHPGYRAACVMKNNHAIPKGERIEANRDGHTISLISLGLIEYINQDDLVEQSKRILKELNL